LLPYSKPTTGSSWLDPFKHERQIHLETILTYVDEIHRHGGRAWAFTEKFALLEAMIGERFATLIDARNGGTCEASLRQLILRCPVTSVRKYLRICESRSQEVRSSGVAE
jgi:hypothetical protein